MVMLAGWAPGVAAEGRTGLLDINATSADGQVPVAVSIPAAGVDADVETQQIVDGQMLDPSGPWIVSWYAQTALVGQRGNAVMAGHVDYWDVGPAVFRNVAALQPGDEIRIVGADGTTYVYVLEYIDRIYLPSITEAEIQSPRLVGDTDYAALTLITCGGEFDYAAGEYLSRDIVRARLVGTDASSAPAAKTVTTSDASADDEPGPALPNTGTAGPVTTTNGTLSLLAISSLMALIGLRIRRAKDA